MALMVMMAIASLTDVADGAKAAATKGWFVTSLSCTTSHRVRPHVPA